MVWQSKFSEKLDGTDSVGGFTKKPAYPAVSGGGNFVGIQSACDFESGGSIGIGIAASAIPDLVQRTGRSEPPWESFTRQGDFTRASRLKVSVKLALYLAETNFFDLRECAIGSIRVGEFWPLASWRKSRKDFIDMLFWIRESHAATKQGEPFGSPKTLPSTNPSTKNTTAI